MVELSREIAERWAELFAGLSRAGKQIPAHPLAVVVTALHLDFGVLIGPNDEVHHRKIPRLRCALRRA